MKQQRTKRPESKPLPHRTTPHARLHGKVWRERFLESLRHNGNISESCEYASVNRRTAYLIRSREPEFAAAWDEAIQHAIDLLEHAAHTRAVLGVEEAVYMKDENGKPQVVGTVRKYSDRLLEQLLRVHSPKFCELHSKTVEITPPLVQQSQVTMCLLESGVAAPTQRSEAQSAPVVDHSGSVQGVASDSEQPNPPEPPKPPEQEPPYGSIDWYRKRGDIW